jgi:hypothetical protein
LTVGLSCMNINALKFALSFNQESLLRCPEKFFNTFDEVGIKDPKTPLLIALRSKNARLIFTFLSDARIKVEDGVTTYNAKGMRNSCSKYAIQKILVRKQRQFLREKFGYADRNRDSMGIYIPKMTNIKETMFPNRKNTYTWEETRNTSTVTAHN